MTEPPSITLLYFAAARSAVNLDKEIITLPETPFRLSALSNLLTTKHSNTELGSVLQGCAWSVDVAMVPAEEVHTRLLRGGEEVAIIPPVSGG